MKRLMPQNGEVLFFFKYHIASHKINKKPLPPKTPKTNKPKTCSID